MVERERGELGSRIGQKPVVVQKTKKLGERERKALFPSKGKGHDDDDHFNKCLKIPYLIHIKKNH